MRLGIANAVRLRAAGGEQGGLFFVLEAFLRGARLRTEDGRCDAATLFCPCWAKGVWLWLVVGAAHPVRRVLVRAGDLSAEGGRTSEEDEETRVGSCEDGERRWRKCAYYRNESADRLGA